MGTFDKSAVNAADMSIKLRHAETNAKLSRTPYNLEQATLAAFTEALALMGEVSAYTIIGLLAREMATDKGWFDGHPSNEPRARYDTAALVEMAVNGLKTDGFDARAIAICIVKELCDMELIEQAELRLMADGNL